ncbi:RMD1 family protein [Aspergillus clavatus NRRL 1]|uniref:YagE family protein n=1 Tax=Aspergillus clavatus (strain ATCC 1007 / CBS 513.65 / DSM 816 / NCTC 3887 / NRRL 1 / QM 1276 / 107) TaxID=344612 RepID=A1CHY2_ASPCL|nr:YagE family protein [Aspergillus clavatus NRRL 1]EAW10487.1 YagE family protein [Aspergillus clavatus NRRL 1]
MSSNRGRVPGQRSPHVLVTDSREQQSQPPRRPPGTRFITVDNVLQYASDVPSMQQRLPPPSTTQSRPRSRLASATGLIGGSGGAGGPGAVGSGSRLANTAASMGRLAAQPRLPPRTTKVSEKLVLLPEAEGVDGGDLEEDEDEDEEVDEEVVQRLAKERNMDPDSLRQRLLTQKRLGGDFGVDNDIAPLLAEEELLRRRKVAPERAKSYAERLPKARRAEKLARVTAYCTAQAYRMSSLAAFVKDKHGGRTKLYDDCLYTAYHLPLLPGNEGYRVRSSPMVKKPGGKSLLDEEIERNELRDRHDDYIVDAEEHSVGGGRGDHGASHEGNETSGLDGTLIHKFDDNSYHSGDESNREPSRDSDAEHRPAQASPVTITAPTRLPYDVAEMFVFSYGVVVFWNLTERQEKDLLADLAFANSSATGTRTPLATMPLDEEDFETEEFHFEYSTEISRPRVYNDMITLRSGDHMIKLAISHGIAQSTKLCFFEEVMARQMAEAKDIPRRLAMTGQLGMKREEVFRILGKLFKSRVEVNLSSNMLDVPNFFWESEPTLYPLYIAVREYLEIKPRIQVLNERCRVFLDLAEILSDSIADNKTSHQTWIIIVLILISIVVTISEVFLRFGLLSSRDKDVSSTSFAAALFSRVANRATCSCPPQGGFDVNASGLGIQYS